MVTLEVQMDAAIRQTAEKLMKATGGTEVRGEGHGGKRGTLGMC